MGQRQDAPTPPPQSPLPSRAEDVARWIVREKVAPLAAAGCAVRCADGWRMEVGGDQASYFDLASVTKPMTAMAVARTESLRDARLGSIVAEARGTRSEDASIEMLLAHRAGLEPHVALFEPLTRGEPIDVAKALARAADARRVDAIGAIPPEGFAPVYSDLGYILAGVALARALGERDAGSAISKHVVTPLGLETTLGSARDLEARGIDLPRVAAPTELVPWRGGEVRGRVHDENAWALTREGASGHAGIFGTVAAVIAFGCAVLDGIDRDLAWLVVPRAGGTLRAGFDGKSPQGSSAGDRAGPRTFGHLGFTGTSLWIDPDAQSVVALLTNRVCPTRDHIAIRTARPLAHDALFARAVALGTI